MPDIDITVVREKNGGIRCIYIGRFRVIGQKPYISEQLGQQVYPVPMKMREWTQDEIDDQMIDASGDDDDFFDCHMGPDGQCGAAGSEWCDWDCPIMARRRGRTK